MQKIDKDMGGKVSQFERDALRKEVFDYLRQLQKREEQAAKISGISS